MAGDYCPICGLVSWHWAGCPNGEATHTFVFEIIEQFVADYVYRKVSYEIGNRRRDGHTDGAESVGSEASLRAGIRVCVRSEIEADFSAGRSVGDLSDLVDRVYEYTLDVWAES
jgi:hypothetical protein